MLRRFLAVLLLAAFPLGAFAQTPGIFAEFTTSLGKFTCKLDYTNAPKAVASFVGLATGRQTWLDEASGRLMTNQFHNGLTFHRVIAGFMIQGGAPHGQRKDGPGYSFVDEFAPSLRFTNSGVLAMANSGPDSNGSQYFITVAPTPWLNDAHTIFGQVVSNYTVVQNISAVATDANERPRTPVVVSNVTILRIGAAASNFNVSAQGLATLENVPLTISHEPPYARLGFTNRLHADNRLFYTPDLAQWLTQPLGVETLSSTNQWPDELKWSAMYPARFFRMARIQYPSTRPAPPNLYGRTLTFEFNGGMGTNTTVFDDFGTGTYTWPTQIGTNTGFVWGYDWSRDPHRGRLYPVQWEYLAPFNLHLSFTTPSNGVFSGVQTQFGTPANGVFRLK